MARVNLNTFSIKDPALRNAIKILQDQIDLVQGATTAAAWKGDVQAGGNALTDLKPGTADTDAVTVAQLKAATKPSTIAANLQAGGIAPLNVTNLIGAGNVLLTGTHAQRLATPPPAPGTLWFETDRTYLYGVTTTNTWLFLAGIYLSSLADRPADLGVADIGATFAEHDYTYGNILWWWSGTSWYGTGTQRGTLGSIPAATNALAGTYYEATDYNRVYLCTGVGWTDAPGQPLRGEIIFYDDTIGGPGAGWALCDGSTVTMTTKTAGTQSYTTPSLNLGNVYALWATSVGPGTAGAAGSNYSVYGFRPYVRL